MGAHRPGATHGVFVQCLGDICPGSRTSEVVAGFHHLSPAFGETPRQMATRDICPHPGHLSSPGTSVLTRDICPQPGHLSSPGQMAPGHVAVHQ